MAFDLNQGCSGYIYGLATASSIMEKMQIKKAALITCDTYSKYISKTNRTCRTLFGDAATLTILERRKEKHFLKFSLGSDPKGFENFKLENNEIKMNGSEMFNFSKNSIPKEILDILKKLNIKKNKIDFFVLHQASKLILETIQNKLEIPHKKLFKNIKNLGNTVSSSIPLALYDLFKSNKIKKGNLLLLPGFGIGYSWGTCVHKH